MPPKKIHFTKKILLSDCKRRICKMPPKLFSKATMAAKVETEDDHDDDDSDHDLYLSIYNNDDDHHHHDLRQ